MITFKTQLNQSKINRLTNFKLKKILFYMIILAILIIINGTVNIVKNNIFMGVFLIIFGIVYVPCVFFISKQSQKNDSTYKHFLHPNAYEIYTFNEEGVLIEQTDYKDFNAKFFSPYQNFYKLYKTKKEYVLYLSKIQIHIIG